MTRKKNFSRIWENVVNILIEKHGITDVQLMMELEFSPPSWKIWKPQIIEMANNRNTRQVKNNIETWYYFEYDKKIKYWVCHVSSTGSNNVSDIEQV